MSQSMCYKHITLINNTLLTAQVRQSLFRAHPRDIQADTEILYPPFTRLRPLPSGLFALIIQHPTTFISENGHLTKTHTA